MLAWCSAASLLGFPKMLPTAEGRGRVGEHTACKVVSSSQTTRPERCELMARFLPARRAHFFHSPASASPRSASPESPAAGASRTYSDYASPGVSTKKLSFNFQGKLLRPPELCRSWLCVGRRDVMRMFSIPGLALVAAASSAGLSPVPRQNASAGCDQEATRLQAQKG